jgi:hypothetical protein
MIQFQQTKAATWVGRVLSVLIALPFFMSAFMKFKAGPEVTEGMAKFGFPETLIKPLGYIELTCVILYLIPQTAFLGAILLTGYLGGAIVTHLRMGEAVPLQVAFGIVIWAGLWLREPRIRALLPIWTK